MVTIAQSAANWCNTHTRMDRTHSLTHLHQHSSNHIVQSASSAVTEFGIKFFFHVSSRPSAHTLSVRGAIVDVTEFKQFSFMNGCSPRKTTSTS